MRIFPASEKTFSLHRLVSGILALGTLAFLGVFQLLTFVLKKAPEPIGSRADLFIEGAHVTLSLTLWSGLIGLFIGILVGLSKMSRMKILRYSADAFIWHIIS